VRRLVALALLAVCLPASPAVAFPDKPLELTVLFGAGSAADLLARKLAELAGQDLGQPVAVVNRTGAGGALGYTHVKGQSPDGYALVWNSNSVSTAYHAGNMKFDHTAFAGVAALTSEPVSLAVKADAPWKDVRELLAHAKAHPGQVRLGNSGRGSFTHWSPSRWRIAPASSSPTCRSAASWRSPRCWATRSRPACSCRPRS
jgi:tripartite-type tricarboxylate transporter receptor subunit TctC